MLTDREVSRIASLARLKLNPEEHERYKKDLSSILDYVNKLNEVNTENIEPPAQVTGLVNVLRSNEPRPVAGNGEHLINQAPHHENNFVKVKSVFEKG